MNLTIIKFRRGGGVLPPNRPNLTNRAIFCRDNYDILRGINSDCIDLIYLDPPFNKKKRFTAPIGTKAEGAAFDDIFKRADVKDVWLHLIEHKYKDIHALIGAVKLISKGDYNWCYLVYMAIRLIECHRVLKPTGSLYLHCDPTMSHYLKLLLDCIFGETNFRNEIVWHYGKWSNASSYFQRNHDIILYYSKSDNYTFNPLYVTRKSDYSYYTNTTKTGSQLLIYKPDEVSRDIIDKYKNLGYSIVYVDKKGVLEHDVWSFLRDKTFNILNSQSKERTGYPTQKPLALLERIIKASSNKGDWVLDPFCGCATTCVAAETLERKWVGVDISAMAFKQVNDRLNKPRQLQIGSKAWQFKGKTLQSTEPPLRTDKQVIKHSDKQMKRLLYHEQAGRCALCEHKYNEKIFDLDHIYPKSKGGPDDIRNRQLLCGPCNRFKSDRLMEDAIALFNKNQPKGKQYIPKLLRERSNTP